MGQVFDFGVAHCRPDLIRGIEVFNAVGSTPLIGALYSRRSALVADGARLSCDTAPHPRSLARAPRLAASGFLPWQQRF
jgi:hypothetical protein